MTGVVAATSTLFCLLWREPWGVVALLAVAFFLSARELARMTATHPVSFAIAALVVSFSFYLRGAVSSELAVSFFWVMGAFSLLVWQPNKKTYHWILSFWLCSGFAVALILCGSVILQFDQVSVRPILFALVPLWVGDSAAYFVGSKWGHRLMAPTISPKKTWEGGIANLVGCMLASFLLVNWLGGGMLTALLLGLSTGVVGQVGDLLQSRLKRLSGVKDSGNVLPGHGGVLDRIDSYLLSSVPSLWIIMIDPDLFHVKQWPF